MNLYFQGHFPNQPIMPGVLVIEAMAQTAAVVVNHSLDMIDENLGIYLLAVDNARFRKMVVPGDILELHMTVVRGRGKYWKLDGKAMVGDELVSEAVNYRFVGKVGLIDRLETDFMSIHPLACISEGAQIGANCTIEAFAFIGPEVVLHDKVHVKPHGTVTGRTEVGEETVVFPLCMCWGNTSGPQVQGRENYSQDR